MLSQLEPSLGKHLLPLEYVADTVLPGNSTTLCYGSNLALQVFDFARLPVTLVGLHACAVRARHLD